MKKIASHIKVNSSDFLLRKNQYAELLNKLSTAQHAARCPEDEKAITKLASRNKYPIRERITRLIDPDSSILELGLLAGLDVYEGVPPGAGIYTLIANVSGVPCVIIANIPSVKGGTYFPLTVKKHLRALEIALENRLPLIYLVDSGGAFLPLQSEIFPDRNHFGRIFYLQSQISAKRIPQIACVLGSCTAGGAYIPAMSEQVIMVEGNSSIFLGGPPLVKAATGEVVSAEELGGAAAHTKISGLSDYIENSEENALIRVRSLVAAYPADIQHQSHRFQAIRAEEPLYDPDELAGILGIDVRQPISAHEIIARLVDGSRFEEFKANYGDTIVCGYAYIKGFLTGIIANNGILFSESALKATHFIQMCDQRGVPLLFLQNIAGFMVGREYEHGGIAKHGAKMVTAVATTRVPKYTIIVAGSFGAGNYSMCGRAYDPRFLFTWPQSKISVMGGSQAAAVLAEVTSAEDKDKFRQETEDRYAREGDAFYATSQLWDDGIISPGSTREILSLSYAATYFEPESKRAFGLFRM